MTARRHCCDSDMSGYCFFGIVLLIVFSCSNQLQLRLALPAGEPLQAQTSVTASMRSVLMDWLVEIAEDMAISDHALFLSSSLVDRFLSRQMVIPNKLQLLGVTALWVAAKLEEVEVCLL